MTSVFVFNDDDPLHSLAMTTIWYAIKRLFRLNVQTSHLRNHFKWFIMYVSIFVTRIHIFNNHFILCSSNCGQSLCALNFEHTERMWCHFYLISLDLLQKERTPNTIFDVVEVQTTIFLHGAVLNWKGRTNGILKCVTRRSSSIDFRCHKSSNVNAIELKY